MKERDYLRKRQEIEDRYRGDLAALERVWAMFHGDTPAPQPTPVRRAGSMPTSSDDSEETMGKRDSVRAVLGNLANREFMSKDVRAELERTLPEVSDSITENQLSSIIARLVTMNELRVTRQKKGRSPALYSVAIAEGPRLEEKAS